MRFIRFIHDLKNTGIFKDLNFILFNIKNRITIDETQNRYETRETHETLKKMFQRGRNALIRYFSFLLTTAPSNWKENNQCRFAFVGLHSCWRR